jgi:transposase
MKLCVGIDLHSTNSFIGIIDEDKNRVFRKKVANQKDKIFAALAPYKDRIAAIAVESTYNWYWLVDMLQENGYPVMLANPCAIQRYSGLKHTDDEDDALWLAEMCQLGILPTGYIYPREERPLRDLLRRRQLFVRHRATYKNSLRSMVARYTGQRSAGEGLFKATDEELLSYCGNEKVVHMARLMVKGISFMNEVIGNIEKEVISRIKLKEDYQLLQTVPGIGKILALTIMLETGDIGRFKKVGNYSSYCRCVKSVRISNGKKKGENNRKNGNPYLSWAYLEAAHFAIMHYPEIKRFYERKKRSAHEFVAIKAVSNKLAKASYYIMRDHVPYDVRRSFAQDASVSRRGVMDKPSL